ncbi:MAG: peptidoglycan DD-metalloendopeptidase family protein [Acidimicrobiia bacterium]|nr:peptidoglycan DD-metalloendopeptidase family protein [Acidimicrobiia bacterium]
MRMRAFAALAVALVVVAAPGVGAAPDPAGLDARIAELQGLVGEASREEAAALADLGAIRARRAELDATVSALDARVAEATARIEAAQAELEQVAARYFQLGVELDRIETAARAAREAVDDTARDLYRRGGDRALAAVVADADSLEEVASATRYLEAVSEDRRGGLDRLLSARDRAEVLQDELEEQRDRAEELRAAAERERLDLARLRAEEAAARSAVLTEEQAEARLVTSVRARKDELTSELAQLKAESDAIARMLRERQAGRAGGGTGQLLVPVPAPVSSGFGPRVHPIFGDTRIHTGIDFSAASGTPIRAAAAGTVVEAGYRGGYGNTVIIDHGGSLATLYAHQSRVAVSAGETVAAGDVIGYVGSTGYSTGAHLHFEVRVDGVPVDPMPYL